MNFFGKVLNAAKSPWFPVVTLPLSLIAGLTGTYLQGTEQDGADACFGLAASLFTLAGIWGCTKCAQMDSDDSGSEDERAPLRADV